MSERNKELMHRAMEKVVSEGELGLIDEMADPDMTNHNPMPGFAPGLEGLKEGIRALRTAFPDLEVQIHDLVSEGDKVVSRHTVRGTHEDEFMGVPPTGKQIEWDAILIFRVVDGKITDQWLQQDRLALMAQLGLVTPPGS
jgi:steroid delta-isomerase-like uncharacterized protein